MKNLILSNSKIRLVHNPLVQIKEFNIDLRKFEIENKTSSIDNFLKIKYLVYGKETKKDKICDRCHKTAEHNLIEKQVLKVQEVLTDGGYAKIDFRTPEERELFSSIINVMREIFSHGKYLCLKCQSSDPDFEEVMEILGALGDVQAMYQEQEENEKRLLS